MLKRFLSILGCVLLSTLPSLALGAEDISTDTWQPQTGDVFVVDVGENTGYLVHSDGQSLSFPVATGRKGYVSYIGRYYRAETPVRTWTAEQFQIKGDRRTFGVSGRFVRLFRSGESSPYGIHSYFKVADWMQEEERYFSMGCIVVTEEVMDVIQKTFEANDQKMTVITTNDARAALEKLTATVVAQNG